MSLSQFDDQAAVKTVESVVGSETLISVGGPLKLDQASQYEMPITVKFLIVQSEEDDHDPTHARRVRGVVDADGSGRWEASVSVPDGLFKSGEARGIAVAVMEKKDQFGYETLTWCDHLELVVQTPAAQASAVGT